MKTSLATATTSGKTLDDVLLSLGSTPIRPNLPSPREILHNCTEEHPGHPLLPADYEQVRNYLLDKKATQKEYHDKSYNAKPLSELEPGQKVLFLSPREKNQYIKGTITTKASTARSYYIEYQGKTYHHTRQHIHTINTEIPVPQDYRQETVQVSQDHQQSQNHSNNPVLQDHHHSHRVSVSQAHQQRYKHKKSTKLITGPPQPPNSIDQLLQYLAAINGHSNVQLPEMNQDVTSTPGTPNSTLSEDSSASSSQTSPSYAMEEETTSEDESTVSTSDRQLRTCAPISYNETVLKHLHGQPQVRRHLTTYPYHFQVIVQKKIQIQRPVKQMKKVNSSYKHSLQEHLFIQTLNNSFAYSSRPHSHCNHC